MVKYSIVVPTYNVEKYIKKCLESITSQTYRNFEIIVVSDGSTDESINIATEVLNATDLATQIICHENIGLGGARNTGIDAANGEYVWFIDSDDYIPSDALEIIDKHLSNTFSDILVFDYQYVDEEENVLSVERGYQTVGCFSLEEESKMIFAPNSACNKIFRLELFKNSNIRFPEYVIYEDLYTVPKLYLLAKKIESINMPLYYYVQRQGSIMNDASIEKVKGIIPALNEVKEYYSKNDVFEKYKDEIEFLNILHGYILSSARVIKYDPKSPIIETFKENLRGQYPNYKSNHYLKTIGIKEKVIFYCVEMKQYKLLNFIFKLRKN